MESWVCAVFIERAEEFLNRIQNNFETDGHFLLLDGHPGTGKTSNEDVF